MQAAREKPESKRRKFHSENDHEAAQKGELCEKTRGEVGRFQGEKMKKEHRRRGGEKRFIKGKKTEKKGGHDTKPARKKHTNRRCGRNYQKV